jgi:hypothetical protein
MTSKALSIRQPWVWLILNGYKDIENRDWRIPVRGRIWIHASKGCTLKEYSHAVAFASPLLPPGVCIPELAHLPRGGLCGSVEIVACVKQSDSPWFVGHWGAVLENPKSIDLLPYPGKLGLFDVSSRLPFGDTSI